MSDLDYSDFFEQLFDKVMKPLWTSKNESYRNSWAGRTGAHGIFCQLERKTDRLFGSIWLGDLDDEKNILAALDNLQDLAIYSIALYVELDSKRKHPSLDYSEEDGKNK